MILGNTLFFLQEDSFSNLLFRFIFIPFNAWLQGCKLPKFTGCSADLVKLSYAKFLTLLLYI